MSVLERFARTNHSVRSRREKFQQKARPAPIQITEDGPSRSLFGRPRDIIVNQLLTPTIRHFSFDGGNLPFSRKSPSPRAQSTESLRSDDSEELGWDKTTLLTLSDSVRASLQHDRSLGPDSEKLSRFLETVLKDEERRHPTLDFETIEHARLDKLLNEILLFVETMKTTTFATDLPLRFRVDAAHCKKLQVIWRHRFREQYIMIDQLRCAVLVKGGRLKDVSFNCALTYDLGKWQTRETNPVSEVEGNQQFEAGHWWLNIVCAQRDGIVACPSEQPTSGQYGITALPLLTGQEEIVQKNGMDLVKYIRKGRSSDMHIALISQVGQKIRILRGHKLKSIYAPRAGVRYDGLYTIRQYGTKLDMVTNTHRLELTLERVKDQKPMEVLNRVPKPSQLDDWKLYEKLEGDKIKLMEGDARYLEWNLQREEERIDREDWRRDREFRASFS
ncbi:hypothetical protein JX266_009728 [Neoarthrinium moseri]|nr:hypothetical protein JX266_009728 [Neoarthrinium moseri]